ncbi:hypothetical protein SAMN05216223_101711 [Actinacidiphila yanglinensis]|uniref:CorA-like Mg2+ transporter protein n=1 Tax=Actinacidiphila yanglinensis TaxID=310779 RepID=A0A1H5TZE7_9ACTN|nr:hypothetical protein [Actinacidiphila yanglinensis]SEF68205.1 hypothetical protein SAMN05216223_101711 [Actinacidiphila yanglinensis]
MTEPGGQTEELTRAFMDAVGTRQTVAVLLPVRLPQDPPWPAGPLPVAAHAAEAEEAARRRLFTPSAGRVLYDRRWHTRPDPGLSHGPMRLDAMELLRTASTRSPDRALAVLHFSVAGAPLLPLLRAISHRRQSADADPLRGPFDPAALLAGVAETEVPAGPFALARPYTVAFMTPPAALTRVMRDPATGELPLDADLLLHALASRASPSDLPKGAESLPELRARTNRISADWSARVLRQGAAFLGNRPDGGPGDFYDYAVGNARGTYLDAILLGAAQRDHIDELTDDLSAVFGGPGLARRVAALERRIAMFRSTHWRQHLSAYGPANDLLLAFHRTYHLPERFAQILAEAADYARLAQNQESQQIAGALGVLTVLGLPVSTALSVLQVLGDTSATDLLVALGASLAATAAALTTRYGRLVLSSLRGSRS